MSFRIVRVSRGSFEPAAYPEIRARLIESKRTLIPAIRALHGCLHFYAAIDSASSMMINASVWESPQDARQMDTLAPMLALAAEFVKLGVRFDRPILNYEVLWDLKDSA